MTVNGNVLGASDLDNYGLSVRTRNRLRAGGFLTAAQVRAAADVELLDIREFGVGCLKEVRDKIGRKAVDAEALLAARWWPREDDTIGGWCVMTADQPPSMADWQRGELQVGSFLGEDVARHVAELHNTWLETRS